jgi:competence protein ComEC
MDLKILTVLFSFALGIFVSSFVFISPLIAVFVLFLGLAIWAVDRGREAILVAIVLTSFALGALRYDIKDFHEIKTPLPTGVVVSEPEDKDNFRRFVMLSDNGERVLVSAPLYSNVQYGDAVEVDREFKRPGVIVDEDSGREFNYGKFLSKDDIYFTLSSYQVRVISNGHGDAIKAFLFKIKKSFVNHTKSILSEPYASLLTGLIVAGRDALPKDILEEFRRAGVIHIVVLSGFNITIIAAFMGRLFRNRFASLIGIILFVVMTGAGASIVRAALMAMIALGGEIIRRKYSAPRALLFAGFLMLLQNPKILVFDPSFQLSFLATLGLIYVMPYMDKCLSRVAFIAKWEQLHETLSQTLSTQVAVLPLLIYMSGDVSIVSIPANLLILLIVPFTMLVGFIAVLLSYIATFLAWPVAFVSYLLLSWILFVSHALGSLPFATIKMPGISIFIILSVYLLWYILNVWKNWIPKLSSR